MLLPLCFGQIILLYLHYLVDYNKIAGKLVSQFALNKDVPLNVYIEGKVSVDELKYNFNATDLVLTGLSQFQLQGAAVGQSSGDKENANLHDLSFYAILGKPSVKGVVKYMKTEPTPSDPEKSVSGGIASALDWNYHFLMTIDVSKKTVESCISVPTGNPQLAAWVSECTGQPVANACPKIDKEISQKRWAIYQAITRRYIDMEFKKMSF